MAGSETSLGETLRTLRLLKGESLKTVGDAAEISPAYLQKLERGDVTSPSPHILHRLADVLGAEYLDLMRSVGYVVPESENSRSGALANAFSSQDLTEGEARAVAAYLKILREQRRDES
jgi:transcriptional regulator with XRE-family HTH domain